MYPRGSYLSGDYYRMARQEQELKDEVFKKLRDWGVKKVVVSFSGYNDEGGPDNCDLIDAKDQKIGFLTYDELVFYELTPKQKRVKYRTQTRTYGNEHWGYRTDKTKVPVVGKTIKGDEFDRFWRVLEGPVDEVYGGWGGETAVWGTVTWDTKTQESEWTEEREYRGGGW